jgi:hypothetical protein
MGAYRHVDALDIIAGAVGVDISGMCTHEAEETVYAVLADLIDRPTCSIKRESRNGYPTTWGVCSRCGAIVNAERAVSNAIEYLPTRYCPNCGAEVVNDA